MDEEKIFDPKQIFRDCQREMLASIMKNTGLISEGYWLLVPKSTNNDLLVSLLSYDELEAPLIQLRKALLVANSEYYTRIQNVASNSGIPVLTAETKKLANEYERACEICIEQWPVNQLGLMDKIANVFKEIMNSFTTVLAKIFTFGKSEHKGFFHPKEQKTAYDVWSEEAQKINELRDNLCKKLENTIEQKKVRFAEDDEQSQPLSPPNN